MTLNQQNEQTCSLGIYITISQHIFLYVSVHVGTSGNQTKVIQHKTKSVTFVHSGCGVRDSNG
jgi:hypothetical protein